MNCEVESQDSSDFCIHDKLTHEIRVMKIKKKYKTGRIQGEEYEINVLRNLDHPNISGILF